MIEATLGIVRREMDHDVHADGHGLRTEPHGWAVKEWLLRIARIGSTVPA
jgi:hypothetical protein